MRRNSRSARSAAWRPRPSCWDCRLLGIQQWRVATTGTPLGPDRGAAGDALAQGAMLGMTAGAEPGRGKHCVDLSPLETADTVAASPVQRGLRIRPVQYDPGR